MLLMLLPVALPHRGGPARRRASAARTACPARPAHRLLAIAQPLRLLISRIAEDLLDQRVQPRGRAVNEQQLHVGGAHGDPCDRLAVALGARDRAHSRIEAEASEQVGPALLLQLPTQLSAHVEDLSALNSCLACPAWACSSGSGGGAAGGGRPVSVGRPRAQSPARRPAACPVAWQGRRATAPKAPWVCPPQGGAAVITAPYRSGGDRASW